MKRLLIGFLLMASLGLLLAVPAFAADAKPSSLTCVSLFSETGEGYASYRVGKADWVVIKVGDLIPANAEIRLNVDRDWLEVIPTGNPNLVYLLEGSDQGDVIKKVSDILKTKGRTVSFPKTSNGTDPKFKDKLVVSQLVGRQIYRANDNSPEQDIHYGDQLDIKGKVRIIGINNTLNLMFPNGKVTVVVGPLKFDVEKVFTGQNLYKYLNVAK